ncbi:phospholipase D-like domain-containing protein [Hahella sp. NBU794]|uniref:phospholipase D-like domain-containing protein n=1 Tax=Hahella sp. NBU794 TaxID=3422590 RepID=UPI003D6FF9D3
MRTNPYQPHPPLKLLKEAQDRGINITVFYGYNHMDHRDADDGDHRLIKEYRKILGDKNIIRLPEGTHEKILIVDGLEIVVGSWNWLSHSYYKYCENPKMWKLRIRRETSVKLNDGEFISKLNSQLDIHPHSH